MGIPYDGHVLQAYLNLEPLEETLLSLQDLSWTSGCASRDLLSNETESFALFTLYIFLNPV